MALLDLLGGNAASNIPLLQLLAGAQQPDAANREMQKIAVANDRLDAVGNPWITNPFTSTMMGLAGLLGLDGSRQGGSEPAQSVHRPPTGARTAAQSVHRPPTGAQPDIASQRIAEAFAPPAKGDRVGGSLRIGGILPEQNAERVAPMTDIQMGSRDDIRPMPSGGAPSAEPTSPILRALAGLSGPDTASLGGQYPDAPALTDPVQTGSTGAPQGQGSQGEIRRGADGQNYQYAQTSGMAGSTGSNGWIPTSMSPNGGGESFRDRLHALAPMLAMLDPLGRNNGMAAAMLHQQDQAKKDKKDQANQSQTLQWLLGEKVDPSTAQYLASDPVALRAWFGERQKGQTPDWKIQRLINDQGQEQDFMVDQNNPMRRQAIGGTKSNSDFKVVGNQLVRINNGEITNVTPAATANVNGASVGIDDLPQVGITPDGVVDQAGQKEFLKALPPSIASQVEGIADGRIDINKVTSLRGGERQELAKIVSLYDPTWDMSQNTARTATRRDYATGEMAKLAASTNLAIQHMGGMVDEHAKLNNTSYPVWNTIANEFSTQTGGAAQKAFETYRLGVADELAKAFKGTGALNKEEVEAWKNAISTSSSPQQLQSAVLSAMHMLAARTETYNQRYRNVMNRDAPGFLTPESAKTLQKLGIDPAELDPRYGGEAAPAAVDNGATGGNGVVDYKTYFGGQ